MIVTDLFPSRIDIFTSQSVTCSFKMVLITIVIESVDKECVYIGHSSLKK